MKLLPLSKRGKHKGKYFAQVDDEDYEELNKYHWQVRQDRKNLYAQRNENYGEKGGRKQKTIHLHRQITGIHDTLIQVDHIDHNGLNNQRSNLRTGTSQQNSQNRTKRANTTSKFRGVCWHKAANSWVAAICINKKVTHIGCFSSEEDAARAYDKRAIEAFGEFANPNFKNPPTS